MNCPYVATYIERDVRSVSNVGGLTGFQRFVGLCAGRTGQLINYSALAADSGVSQPTAKAWLSILEAGFILFRLPAWSGNVRKRLVKMPKLIFHDTGLVCWLLGLRSFEQLRAHPLRGAIFESWVISGDFTQSAFYIGHSGLLRQAFRLTRTPFRFSMEAVVSYGGCRKAMIILRRLGNLWRAYYSRWFERCAPQKNSKGEHDLWQRRYWEHTMQDGSGSVSLALR